MCYEEEKSVTNILKYLRIRTISIQINFYQNQFLYLKYKFKNETQFINKGKICIYFGNKLTDKYMIKDNRLHFK